MQDLDQRYEDLERELADHFLVDGGRLAVVKAPPGSGKTHTLTYVLKRLVSTGMRIAVAAQTNAQADDICRRLAGPDFSELVVTRFASSGHLAPDGFPSSVVWASKVDDLPGSPGVVVATTAKWSLTRVNEPFAVLAIDEAWQMGWADLMQCANVSERFLLIGDPGQIPPVVTIDVRRWETSPRAPHAAAPSVVLADDDLMADGFSSSIPACRRLPAESVDFVKPFYDFDFAAYVEPGSRGLDLPTTHDWASLSSGAPLVLTIPTPIDGPPIEVDHELAQAVSQVVSDLLDNGAIVRTDKPARELVAADVGVTSSHRVMNAAIEQALGAEHIDVRVDTPERWQGLERPVMIAIHPLSGVVSPSSFDLETGRLCVMASRHQSALIILTRDHVPDTLLNHVPSAEQAPGRPDTVGRGHDAHLRFWSALDEADRVRAL